MTNYLKLPTRLLFSLLILFGFYIIFYNLGKPTLENWDEAWYGEMTKQMLRTKEFIILQWNHDYLLDKPPMYIWFSAFFSSILGLSEFSIRLTSALSGFTVIVMVLLYAFKQWGFVPSIIAYSSIAFNNIFIWRARSGNIDVFVTLLIFASYFLMLSNKKERYLLLGIVFACIYLTKASLVFFPLTIFILYEILYKRKEIEKTAMEYLKLFSVLIVLAGTWLFLGYVKLGNPFITYYLFSSDQGLLNINLLKYKSDYLDYAYYSLQRRYYYVFLLGLFFLIRKIKIPRNFLILFFAVLLLIFLSFTKKSNNWYLIPSIPFWSLTIAYGTYKFIQIFRNLKIIVLAIIAVTIFISYRTYTVNILPILNTFSTAKQAESAIKIKTLSQKNDIIVRLDHLYATTIYYSDRKVLSSPIDSGTRVHFISRRDLAGEIEKGKIKWLVGTASDVEKFIKENSIFSFKKITVNETESIIQVL